MARILPLSVPYTGTEVEIDDNIIEVYTNLEYQNGKFFNLPVNEKPQPSKRWLEQGLPLTGTYESQADFLLASKLL